MLNNTQFGICRMIQHFWDNLLNALKLLLSSVWRLPFNFWFSFRECANRIPRRYWHYRQHCHGFSSIRCAWQRANQSKQYARLSQTFLAHLLVILDFGIYFVSYFESGDCGYQLILIISKHTGFWHSNQGYSNKISNLNLIVTIYPNLDVKHDIHQLFNRCKATDFTGAR